MKVQRAALCIDIKESLEPVILYNGDIIIIGPHKFKLLNPLTSAINEGILKNVTSMPEGSQLRNPPSIFQAASFAYERLSLLAKKNEVGSKMQIAKLGNGADAERS